MITDAAFLARLRAAPDYAEAPAARSIRPAQPVEVLYQMVAVESGDPTLCERVSPNATIDAYGRTRLLLRAHCFASVAYNTKHGPLCGRLPAAGSFPHLRDLDSAEGCRRNIQIRLRSGTSGGRHGAIPFEHAADFAAALQRPGRSSSGARLPSRVDSRTPASH